MKKISVDTKLTIQVIMSIVLIIAGLTLLFLGFYFPPQGEIHDSVLIAYGEIATFSGSLLGLDYSYKYKLHKFDLEDRRRKEQYEEREINDEK